MTIVCVPPLLSVHHPSSPERPVPKLTSLIYLSLYPSWLLTTPLLSFFFFIYHLKTFLTPLFTVQWQLHPWLDRECAAAKTGAHSLFPECLPLLICVSIYLCEITSCNVWLWGCQMFFFVCIICHNCFLTSLCLAMFSGCISPCIRRDLNIKHELSAPCAG